MIDLTKALEMIKSDLDGNKGKKMENKGKKLLAQQWGSYYPEAKAIALSFPKPGMKQIKIIGAPSNGQEKEAKKAVQKMINKIGKDAKGVKFIIEFTKEMHKGSFGSCFGAMMEDGQAVVHIEINANKGISEMLNTIYHEMAHAAQICEGRLTIANDGTKWYEGKDVTFMDYQEMPHEHEANIVGYRMALIHLRGVKPMLANLKATNWNKVIAKKTKKLGNWRKANK